MAMKAPSPSCLRALRFIIYPEQHITTTQYRCYATTKPSTTPKPSPTSTPTTREPPVAPKPIFRPSPSGSDLRKRRDDDEDFTPYPLPRPIGMPNSPEPGENTGLDHRSLRQRRDDFHDYNKHLERRAKMTKQLAKPYFRDWSNMRFHKGKVFVANSRLFRAEHALFFPNFFGKTLEKGAEKRDRKDGYGGVGRDTCAVMKGKVSVVSIVSNAWAEGQVASFCSEEQNPALHQVLKRNEDVAQRVEINHENNFLKWHLLQWTAAGRLRQDRSEEQHRRYFMVRRGVSDMMKEAIGLLNDKGGYVYLVDPECKIRWAGSAEAQPEERESMIKGLQKLIQEARTPPEKKVNFFEQKQQLQDTVADITA